MSVFPSFFLAQAFSKFTVGCVAEHARVKTAIALLSLSTLIVILLLLFPQTLASVLAEFLAAAGNEEALRHACGACSFCALSFGWHYYGGSRVPAGQPALISLNAQNLDGLRAAFNAASDDVRVVLLLSPT